MQATGIVRRIDDLGRVVIPKEIRKILRIKEGDPLELFVDQADKSVRLKLYSELSVLPDFLPDYVQSLSEITGYHCFVADRTTVVAASKNCPKITNKETGNALEIVRSTRLGYVVEDGGLLDLFDGTPTPIKSAMLEPIECGYDVYGVLVFYSTEIEKIPDAVKKCAEAGIQFLQKQIQP